MNEQTYLQRIDQLLEIYGAPSASVAALLCDEHQPSTRAYRIIAPDLSANDISYGELRRESEKFAAVLHRLGVRTGDRVATLMGKSREYIVTLMGIWRLGAVHVPLFTAFAPPAIFQRLSGSAARLVVCDPAQQAKLASEEQAPTWQVMSTGAESKGVLSFNTLMAEAAPGFPAAAMGGDAPLIHIYTSGTTGSPKGVVVPIRALASFRAYAEFGLGLQADDTFWCAADPGWAYGLYFGILATFTTGVKSILVQGGFSAETTMVVLEREKVSNFAAAPTVYRSLRSSGLVPWAPLSLRCASNFSSPSQ